MLVAAAVLATWVMFAVVDGASSPEIHIFVSEAPSTAETRVACVTRGALNRPLLLLRVTLPDQTFDLGPNSFVPLHGDLYAVWTALYHENAPVEYRCVSTEDETVASKTYVRTANVSIDHDDVRLYCRFHGAEKSFTYGWAGVSCDGHTVLLGTLYSNGHTRTPSERTLEFLDADATGVYYCRVETETHIYAHGIFVTVYPPRRRPPPLGPWGDVCPPPPPPPSIRSPAVSETARETAACRRQRRFERERALSLLLACAIGVALGVSVYFLKRL